jgi:predicted nucleic acid-binding protein
VTPPARGVLDTSVFIARENGRPLDESMLPDESAICVVTLAELHAGVLAATDTDVRARRLATLNTVADMYVLPIAEDAAIMWGRMRAHLAENGRRVNVNGLWIAATAAAHRLPVITQDGDFEPLAGLADLAVIEV